MFDSFSEWVDSFGSGAGDHMMAGAVCAAIVGGGVCLGFAVALESPVLLVLGFVAIVGHILFAMAAL